MQNTDTDSTEPRESNSINQPTNGVPNDGFTGIASAHFGRRECKSAYCKNTAPSYREYCDTCRPGIGSPIPNPTPDAKQTCKTPVCDNDVKPWEEFCSECSLSIDDLDIINTPPPEADEEESQLDRVERKLDRLLEFFEIDDVQGDDDG